MFTQILLNIICLCINQSKVKEIAGSETLETESLEQDFLGIRNNERLVIITPGANNIKLFTAVSYEFSQ